MKNSYLSFLLILPLSVFAQVKPEHTKKCLQIVQGDTINRHRFQYFYISTSENGEPLPLQTVLRIEVYLKGHGEHAFKHENFLTKKNEVIVIYADDLHIAENIEIPLQMGDFFTFKIPKNSAIDGELYIRFERAENVAQGDRVSVEQWRNTGGWGIIVSEVWLIKN
jgi:hypothetical protein